MRGEKRSGAGVRICGAPQARLFPLSSPFFGNRPHRGSQGLFMIKFIATDLDGTLLDEHVALSEEIFLNAGFYSRPQAADNTRT